MKIASWNLRNNYRSSANRYDGGKFSKLDLIERLQADVVFLSEAADDGLVLYYGLKDIEQVKLPDDQRGVGFWCKSGWQVEVAEPLFQDALFGLCVMVTSPQGQRQKVFSVWNYLPWNRDERHGYLDNLKVIFNHAPYHRFIGDDTLVLGDFNVLCQKEGAGERQLQRISEETRYFDSLLPNHKRLENLGQYTWYSKRKESKLYTVTNKCTIDHVFVPRQVNARLCDNKPYEPYAFRKDRMSASDHLPVIVEI